LGRRALLIGLLMHLAQAPGQAQTEGQAPTQGSARAQGPTQSRTQASADEQTQAKGQTQGPAAAWRTLTTAHFRVHYPQPFAAWAERAAGWLEAVRGRAIAEIGFAPADVADVVVSDPQAEANGVALPLRGWPRLVLWTSPPPPDSEIGYYRDWTEDLLVHEQTHLVHLLRPSRNPLLGSLLPVGPIALAPRWVVEGYATLIEGRLTGAGRPNGDLRAAILRRWAQAGRLPSYGRLASDSHAWRGMSMAYLLGSAYLEWLEQRAGPGSLRKLWARMTARTGRGFGEAFAGIWESSPESLYDRFRAELTYRAMEAEKRVQAVGPLAVREGALWQSFAWTTGAPAVSPDGSRLALVRRFRDRPAELAVWSTAPDLEAEKRWREEQARQQARDPQDVPAVRTRPLPRKPLFRWAAAEGGDPATPRFLPGGESLLLVRFLPDPEGFIHPDLFVWRPSAGEMSRITHQADLRDPDPSPDGRWAVAVRDRFGLSQLVTVELPGGEVRPLTEPSLERVYDRPRIAPDGRRVAFGLHAGGSWRLAVLELAPDRTAGREVELAPPPGATAASPAWSPDGRTLYAVVGRGGFIDLYAFDAAPGGATAPPAAEVPPPRALTRTQGGAFAPAPTPDGSGLFYLSLVPDGLDLRRLDLTARRPPLAEVTAPADLAPAVRPAPPPAPPLPPAAPPLPPAAAAGRAYGAGRQELLPLVGGGAGSAGGTLELGLRSGDLIGRLDLLALGAVATSGAPRGGALAGSWRGWPAADVGLHAFDVRETPSRQAGRVPPAAAAAALDLERRGLEAAAEWRRQAAGRRLRLRVGWLWQRLSAAEPDAPAAAATAESAVATVAGAARSSALAAAGAARSVTPAAVRQAEPAGAAAATHAATKGAAADAPAAFRLLPARAVADEAMATADGGYQLSRRLGLWRLGAGAGGRLAAGRTGGGGGGWWRYGGDLALSARSEGARLELFFRRDGSHGIERTFDLYQLGGAASSLLPPAALASRIVQPALPAATLLGAEHESERAELGFGFLPVPLFYERHRLWGGLLSRPAEITLAGLEYRTATAPVPLVRLPGLELRVGAARVFSAPAPEKDQTRWWLATVWRP
jgi:WD40-like Beta Propeller Repeat